MQAISPSDFSPRSFLRNSHGPRAVDTGQYREKVRSSGRQSRDGEDKEHPRSKKSSHEKKSKSKVDASKQSKGSKSLPHQHVVERPSFRMDVFNAPPRMIGLGMETSISVLISVQYPRDAARALNVDVTRLFAVASLVGERRDGSRMAMEAGSVTADRLVDSVRPLPREIVERRRQTRPDEATVGFCQFAGLLIRQSGQFRIRLTLIQMPGAGSCISSPTSIISVDSELISVERRRVHQHSTQRSCG